MNDGRNVYSNGNGRFIAWNKKFKYWGIVDSYPNDQFYGKNDVSFGNENQKH